MTPTKTDAHIRLADRIRLTEAGPIKLYTMKTGAPGLVTISGSFPAGDKFSPKKNSMIADLTGYMLDRGTVKLNKYAFAERLENLGASVSISVGTHAVLFSVACLKEDLKEVTSLFAQQVMEPALEEEELVMLKKTRAGQLRQALENNQHMAAETLSELIFEESHPNHAIPTKTLIEDIDTVTVEDLRAFHQKFYGPESLIMIAVGDADPHEVREVVGSAFESWSGGSSHPEVKPATASAPALEERVTIPDKASVTVMMGQATGLKDSDPDYVPLMMGSYVLGGNFSARLMSIVRDDEGLTYGIYSGMDSGTFCDGLWSVRADFSPENLNKGLASTRREVERWIRDGVTEKELDEKKTTLIGSYKVQLATTRGMAGQILSFLQKGFDLSYLDRYPEIVASETLENVNSKTKQYLDPKAMHLAMAGTFETDKLKD